MIENIKQYRITKSHFDAFSKVADINFGTDVHPIFAQAQKDAAASLKDDLGREIEEWESRLPDKHDLALDLFKIHTHAEVVEYEDYDQVVYREKDIVQLLRSYGFQEPDFSSLTHGDFK